tara:strand:+ start:731 stop:922 length:192 start_codon:yes stop_codon:yes gene_type:complete
MTKTETWNLRAFACGDTYAVEDDDGGIWHPNEDSEQEIARAADPKKCAIALVIADPMSGEWHS